MTVEHFLISAALIPATKDLTEIIWDAFRTSKGGKNTKIHTIVDGLGNSVSFLLSGGQVHDRKMAVPLLKTTNIKGSHILADRAYGSVAIRTYITEQYANLKSKMRKITDR